MNDLDDGTSIRWARFDPQSPARVGDRVRINSGQLKGRTGEISGVDQVQRLVHVTITIFDRPVDIEWEFGTATEILDVATRWHEF